jgi:hypothetical protein
VSWSLAGTFSEPRRVVGSAPEFEGNGLGAKIIAITSRTTAYLMQPALPVQCMEEAMSICFNTSQTAGFTDVPFW